MTNCARSFFVKNSIVGGLNTKGHTELTTDFQAGNIFDNPRTKEKEKGQRRVSLFWARDDSKNVKNFSMLIIMGPLWTFSLLEIHLQLNCLLHPGLPRNKLKTKNAAKLNFSMCDCPCMTNIVWDIFEKDAKCFFIAITFKGEVVYVRQVVSHLSVALLEKRRAGHGE